MVFGRNASHVRLEEDRLTEAVAALVARTVEHRIERERARRGEGTSSVFAVDVMFAWADAARRYARLIRPWDPACIDVESRRVLKTLEDACLGRLDGPA